MRATVAAAPARSSSPSQATAADCFRKPRGAALSSRTGSPSWSPSQQLPEDLVHDDELVVWDTAAGRLSFAALQGPDGGRLAVVRAIRRQPTRPRRVHGDGVDPWRHLAHLDGCRPPQRRPGHADRRRHLLSPRPRARPRRHPSRRETSNILLGEEGSPHLADFGLSRTIHDDSHSAHDTLVGTLAYMAPERFLGQGASTASDIYALGMTLLEALTGHREYQGTSTHCSWAPSPAAHPMRTPARTQSRAVSRRQAASSALRLRVSRPAARWCWAA
ncbi:protein kinase [Streptomyces sp. NPDC091204]|uniref:protein kinase domain-containing protein n=1 Tax=Streptomyces sp. NPDC091204 TaxID=3155299 RepID=UPI00342A484F